MADKIEVYTSYNEKTNTLYHSTFEIVDSLLKPGDEYRDGKVKEVNKVEIDISQSSAEAFNYDYYEIITEIPNEEGSCDTDIKYVAISNTIPNHTQIIVSFNFVPPTAKDAGMILTEYLKNNPSFQLKEELFSAIECDNDEDYTDDQLLSRYFGISDKLYENCALCSLGNPSRYSDPQPADIKNASISDMIENITICGGMEGIHIYAKVPYWWGQDECVEINKDSIDETILDELPERHVSDLHQDVLQQMLEDIEEGGEGWVMEVGYPTWFDLISLKPNEILKISSCITDIILMPFKDFIKKCGFTRLEFAKRFHISEKTVNEWVYGESKVKPYIRLMLAEISHLYD